MKKLLFFILYIPLLINAQTFEESMELYWLQHELEFQHQPIDHQFRSNDDGVLKLGDVIYNLFDIRKEEVYVLTINDGETTILETEDDIWNYDLLSQFRRTDDGLYTYRQTEGCSNLTSHIVLNLSYRTYDKSSNDKSISKINGMLNIHLQYPSGIKDKAIYIQATFCHPPIMLERTKHGILPQPESKSILFAYDYRSEKENIDQFNNIYNSAREKVNKKDYDNLTYLERSLLLLEIHPDIQRDFYLGKKKYDESSYWDAILYFENVYNALTSYFWRNQGLNDDDLSMLSESSFYIGMCYYDLGLHTKALKYIDFAKDMNPSNYTYKSEYINCLIFMHDIRALPTIRRFIIEFHEILEETEELDSGGFEFLSFLQRREIYCLIDLNMINEAEELLDLYLILHPESQWAISELEYIKSIEKK